MATQYDLEWCNENMHRNYPLMDSCTPVTSTGIYLPSSFLVDMDLFVPTVTGTADWDGTFYIAEVVNDGNSIIVSIGYKPSGSGTDDAFICAISNAIDISTTSWATFDNHIVALSPASTMPSGYEVMSYLSGRLVIGSCVDIANYGVLQFTHADTPLNPLRIHSFAYGLESVTILDNNGTRLGKFTTDFTIQAGEGITFSVDSTTNTLTITHEAQDISQAIEDIISQIYTEMGSPILTINGISPTTTDGRFELTGGDCTTLDGLASGVLISNPCSKPCCDNTSASDVQSALELLKSASDRLLNYYEALTTNINMMQARLSSLIASRK